VTRKLLLSMHLGGKLPKKTRMWKNTKRLLCWVEKLSGKGSLFWIWTRKGTKTKTWKKEKKEELEMKLDAQEGHE